MLSGWPLTRAVQVYHVEPGRALLLPGAGHVHRVVGEHGHLLEVALPQPHDFAVFDVY